MFYGHAPHVPGPDDLTIIKCRECGWISPEMTRAQESALGVPWYCDACGVQVKSWVTFAPSERTDAYRAIGGTIP